MEGFDFVVVGSGPGGTAAAFRAANGGASTCLIERSLLGGVCLNTGCIPTKSLLRSAGLLSQIERARGWGIEVEGVSIDFKKAQHRKGRVVSALAKSLRETLDKKGVRLVEGEARLGGLGEVGVSLPGGETKALRARKVVLATGTRPLVPKGFPFDGERVLTSDEALQLQSLPRSILVVGGGFIGCEFAYLFGQCGAEVTLVEQRERLLSGMDECLGDALTRGFKRMGIRVITGQEVDDLELKQGTVTARVGQEVLEVEKVMLCLGRIPNTRGIGLEGLGVQLDGNSFVEVDGHCRTTASGIYAVGDITNKGQLANVAFRQGTVAVEHALGLEARMDYSVVPGCVFTQPEVATVGLSEEAARLGGRRLKVETFPMRWLGKAWVYGETEGFLKLVADEETGALLGVHLVGPYAGELIGEASLALKARVTLKDLASAMPIHPSYSEALTEAARGLLGIGMYG
jgi:dihydrolipoamide dehydrogenase